MILRWGFYRKFIGLTVCEQQPVASCMTEALLSGSVLLPPSSASCPSSVYAQIWSPPLYPFDMHYLELREEWQVFLLTSAFQMKLASSQDTGPGWIQFSRLDLISSTVQFFIIQQSEFGSCLSKLTEELTR